MTAYDVGILPSQEIRAMADAGGITADRPFDPDQIQPASIDLRLGAVAHRLRASFLPGPHSSVEAKLDNLRLHTIDLSEGAVLETGCVYLVPVLETFALPDHIAASANPKSSTGRLDVFTRVITDGGEAFDTISGGYRGGLYVEISPRTFPVLVRTGSRLSQVRFRTGSSILTDEELADLHNKTPLVDTDPARFEDGLTLSIDLEREGSGSLLGYRAKRHTGVIDVDKKNACDVLDYWEPIHSRGVPSLILDPGEFYILASREAVHVPPDTAAEMVAIDPLVGEFRVHYAGFFDPGFGHAAAGGKGSRAVLEVRSREVPFILEHGQTIGRLVYERMKARPDTLYGSGIGSNYQAQGLKLSKHFRG
ncbi:Deoxycytidine triphosphate deaminase [Hartmannibacter diazotrophicus]|uniref:Deoxycytidine triphosphate deaminase n=1 Tax=Hartmannibacter diazotrophicus TaxID=1482074 RepID=A0A2C9D1J3_9HYPH|nr:2'-deoxycytidine 5'-triphosphate deaminase [Hartmannibacter diazotrophicus]SON54116.1 Deoxycytidine triphosphate deaminase [Hartmannibacter diazotrophicus]